MMKTTSTRRPTPRTLAAALTIALLALGGCERQHTVAESMAIAKDKREHGDNKTALIELKNVLQQEAGNQDARLMLVETYLDSGRGMEAEIELRRLADAGVDASLSRRLLGRSLLLQGNYDRVISEVRVDPAMNASAASEISEMRGRALLAVGRKAEAAKDFAQSLVDQPGYPEALIGQAQIAMLNGDFAGSSRLVEQVLTGKPDSVRALMLRADLQRYSGHNDEALKTYARVLELQPDSALALSTTAYLRITAGQFDLAEQDIAKIRAFGNGVASANYLQALMEYRKKNYRAARDAIDKALATAPEHLPSVMLSGSIDYQLGEYEQAEVLLRRVMAASPSTIYNRQVLAMTLMKENRGADAAEVLAPVLQSVDDPKIWALAGSAFTMAKQYRKATEAFARASTLQPDDAQGKLRLGVSRLSNGEGDRALGDIEAAIQLQPDNTYADFFLVTTRIRRGEYDAALEAVRDMEKRQPTNPIAFNLEGGALLAKNDVPPARAAFEKALAIEPAFVPAAINLARLDLIDGKPEAAKDRFKSIVAKSPPGVEGLVAYANLLRELRAPRADVVSLLQKARAADPKAVEPRIGLVEALLASDPKQAAVIANEAVAIDPSNISALDALGMAQALNGEQNASMVTYRKLVELQPRAAVARLHLAELYVQNGNPVAATRELRGILEFEPANRDAQLMLAGLEARAGHIDEALRIAQDMQKANPKLVAGFILEGDVQLAAKNPPRAVAAYEKAFAINGSAPLLLKLHAASLAAGKAASANAQLVHWLSDHPDDVDVRYYYANSLLREGQGRAAAEQLKLVIQKEPKQAFALNDLAWLQGQAKDPGAVDLAKRAHDLLPTDVHIADTYGSLLVERGQTQQAIDVFRKATEASPTAYDLRMRLARAYLKNGDTTNARQQFEFVSNAANTSALRVSASKELQQLNDK